MGYIIFINRIIKNMNNYTIDVQYESYLDAFAQLHDSDDPEKELLCDEGNIIINITNTNTKHNLFNLKFPLLLLVDSTSQHTILNPSWFLTKKQFKNNDWKFTIHKHNSNDIDIHYSICTQFNKLTNTKLTIFNIDIYNHDEIIISNQFVLKFSNKIIQMIQQIHHIYLQHVGFIHTLEQNKIDYDD